MAEFDAVFFDIDGTLVPFGATGMPQSTVAALDALRARGVKVIVNSGRPPMLINNLGGYPFDGFVCMNGGLLILEGKVVWKKPIDREDALAVIRISEELGVSCAAFTEDSLMLNFHSENEIRLAKAINIEFTRIGDIRELLRGGGEICQFTVYADESLEKHFLPPATRHICCPRWSPEFMDIDPDSTSKADGIRRMAGILGIDASRTMAFGDGGNDISMLKAAGVGVAMGNASDDVKSHAAYVTTSASEDGIANALKHFGLV